MDEIILLDGLEDFIKIKKKMKFQNEQKIITFDFESHKELKKLQINHEMIEDLISVDDEVIIDKKSFQMATEWNQIKEISELLTINELNLGELLNHEMTEYFTKHLKRIVGIKKIIEKEKPNKIICHSLDPYIKLFNKQNKIQISSFEYKLITNSRFDQIYIPVTVLGKTYRIKISRKRFLQVKKNLNKSIIFILKLKPNYLKFNDWILLLDFSPVRYQHFFNTMSKNRKNILLLNQRRPAIWNLQSMSIIRRSKFGVMDLEFFTSREKEEIIQQLQKDIEENIEKIFKNNKFIEFFKIDQYSFFNAISDDFFQIIIKRFKESIQKMVLVEELFNKCKITCVLEWGHVTMEEKIVLHISKQKKIPTLFLQHGIYTLNKKFEKYINHLAILPSENSKTAIWGEVAKNYLVEHNVNKNDFFITGSPRHDSYFKNISETQKPDLVLILANGFAHINYTGRDTRAFEYLENSVKEIIRVLKEHNKEIIVKMHPGYSYYDIRPLIKKIDPKIKIFHDQDIQSFLRICGTVISLNYSTTLLEAMILKKPTMLILPDDQKFEEELPVKRNATLYVDNISKIEQELKNILTDYDTRQKLINEGNKFVNEYCSHKGLASKKLLEIINNIVNNK